MGESPRWHDGRFWMCDWMAGEVLAFDADGSSGRWWPGSRGCRSRSTGCRTDASWSPPLPAWSPGRTWRRTALPGSRSTRSWSTPPATAGWTCPARCRGRSRKPGIVAVVRPDGTSEQVADDVWFPNGMAIIDDGHAGRRRVARRPADRVDPHVLTARSPTGGSGRSSARPRRPTASASTRPGRSGTPRSPAALRPGGRGRRGARDGVGGPGLLLLHARRRRRPDAVRRRQPLRARGRLGRDRADPPRRRTARRSALTAAVDSPTREVGRRSVPGRLRGTADGAPADGAPAC